MKKSLGFAFLILALIHCGASAPRQGGTGDVAGTPKKAGSSKASVSPQGFAADQIMKFFGRKTGNDLMIEKKSKKQENATVSSKGVANTAKGFDLPPKPMSRYASSPTKATGIDVPAPAFQLPSKPVPGNVSGILKSQKRVVPAPVFQMPAKPVPVNVPSVMKVKKIVIPPPQAMGPSVVAIREEIQKIFSLNKSISQMNAKRAAQIAKAQGKASVHEKILDVKGDTQKPSVGRGMPGKSELLAQEKLRSAHEEIQRNAQMTDELNGIPTVAGPEPEKKS